MRLYIRDKFSAAHFLYSDVLSDEQNVSVYGKCNNLHGHTWLVEIWIEGEVSDTTGMVVNFSDVKRIVRELDHTYLNKKFDGDLIPTAENLTQYIAFKVKNLPGVDSVKVRVWESENAYAEVEL